MGVLILTTLSEAIFQYSIAPPLQSFEERVKQQLSANPFQASLIQLGTPGLLGWLQQLVQPAAVQADGYFRT